MAVLLFVSLVVVITGISMLNGYTNTTAEQNIFIFSEFGLASLIISVITWVYLRREIICPYIIYLIASYTFMYGQGILWALSIEFERKNLYNMYTPEVIFPGMVYSLFALLALHIGAVITAKDNSFDMEEIKKNQLIHKEELDLSFKAIKTTAWLLFAISIVPFAYVSIRDMINVSKSIYRAIYYHTASSRFEVLVELLETFFVPSLFLLLIAYRKNRPVITLVVCMCIVYISCQFFIGLRSNAFMVFIALMCAWHYLITPFKFKHILFFIIVAYILFTIGTVLGQVRNLEGRTFADYIDAYRIVSEKENPVVSLFGEMGWTMSNTIEVIKRIPDQYDFRYGSSYLYSLTTIIPNLGFWDVHPATANAQLSNWLQGVMNLSYGPGFSPIAEAYTNFGWFGIFFMVGEGSLMSSMLSLSDKRSILVAPERMSVGIVFLLVALKESTRASSIIMVRQILYNVLPVYLLILVVKFSIKRINERSSGNKNKASSTIAGSTAAQPD